MTHIGTEERGKGTLFLSISEKAMLAQVAIALLSSP
jgi:hypothetical protein